jgi:hypothetical protein
MVVRVSVAAFRANLRKDSLSKTEPVCAVEGRLAFRENASANPRNFKTEAARPNRIERAAFHCLSVPRPS